MYLILILLFSILLTGVGMMSVIGVGANLADPNTPSRRVVLWLLLVIAAILFSAGVRGLIYIFYQLNS